MRLLGARMDTDAGAAFGSPAEFYAHACAMEREAAERYKEFADYFSDRGEQGIAALCSTLAVLDEAARRRLSAQCDGMEPPIPAEDRWLDAGPPEAAAHEFVFRAAYPRQLLEIAFAAEQRARAYFDRVAAVSSDFSVRQLAARFADEELEHARWVEEALNLAPNPNIDWESYFAESIGR